MIVVFLVCLCCFFAIGHPTIIIPDLEINTKDELSTNLIRQKLILRHQELVRVASTRKLSQPCSSDKYIIITEIPYGRAGNHIIEFSNGLYVADKIGATLVVPKWMADIFEPVDTSLLKSRFCFVIDGEHSIASSAKKFEITSEDSLFAFKLFNDPIYQPLLPKFSVETIHEISILYIQVYSALWSTPKEPLLSQVEYLITNHLNGNFRYTAIHRRQLEGHCSKILSYVTIPTDFSPKQLPMDRSEWSGRLRSNHPLCDMNYDFVVATQNLNHRNNSKIYVAHDGKGIIESYAQYGSAFHSFLEQSKFPVSVQNSRYIDMLMMMHSDLFILNPRSTMSWQVYLIRVCWGLDSVPIVTNNDFFMQKIPEEMQALNRSGLWVSWTSVLQSVRFINRPSSD